MDEEKLKLANKLNKRIQRLDLLKTYLQDDTNVTVWHDFIRLFLPSKLVDKVRHKDIDFMHSYEEYDKMFADDVCQYIDELLEKYKKLLSEL